MNRIIEIALTDLATKLNEARIAANDIEETASARGVYGDISDALQKTLALLLDGRHERAEAVYQSLLDGNTVAQALVIDARERTAMAALDNEPETAGGRIRKALDALALHGVSEKQAQTKSEISDERWADFTDTEKAGLPGIRTVELAMPKTPPSPVTTEQAIERARRIIDSAQKLTRAAETVSESRGGEARAAAESVKEHELLK